MAALTEGMHEGEFIGELAMGVGYHVDAITLSSGENLVAGAVLGVKETGTPTATAGAPFSTDGTTVGNGTVSAVSADAGAMAGDWQVEITGSGATAAFRVRKPDGTIDGTGAVGTAYNGTGSINITIADGSTDWAANHIIPVSVEYDENDSALEYVEYDPDGTDGSQNIAGILMKNTDATSADVVTTALKRGPASVNANDLTWITGITADQITAGKAALLNLGIKAA